MPASRSRVRASLLAATAVALSVSACSGGAASTESAPTTTTGSTTTTTTAASSTTAVVARASTTTDSAAVVTALETLPVKGRAPKTGYTRDQFGPAWSDDVTVAGGHNGCDTRNDILRRDLTNITTKAGSNDCTVLTGTLQDTYTATTIDFVRGEGTSTAVQIDHVVALSDAWQKGAQQLDEQTRRNFANDPRNLQAVDGPANQQKSDGDAATWLPANKSYRCTYVARQVEVKAAYQLWVTQAEKDAISRVLGDCGVGAPATASATSSRVEPTTTLPTTTVAPPAMPSTTVAPPAPAPVREEPPRPAPAPAPAPSVSYANCAAVRAAGAAPIYAGQPGYSRKLDRDGDGVACE